MELPAAIQSYFDADRQARDRSFISVFAPDAVVVDEGQTHAGHNAISAWWRAAKSQYDYKVEPLAIDAEGNTADVRAEVRGQFPGSPVTLSYAFRLEHDLISHLEIKP